MSSTKKEKWQDKSFDIQEALCYAYKYDIFHDVTIQCTDDMGSTMSFNAHKLVLASRSSVFADLFYSKNQNSRIVSVNVNPRIMDILLWYIYSDSIEEEDVKGLIESFYAAVEYEIGGFTECCVEKLLYLLNLNISNVYSVLEIAKISKSEELHDKCIQCIINNSENVLLSNEFQLISEETLSTVLKEINQITHPKTVLTAVIKWMTKNNFTERKFLTTIEFSLFSADDFLNIVEEFPDFFTADEKRSLLQNLMIPESSELPLWCKFSKTRERCIKISLTSPHQVMEIIKEKAVKVKTACNRKFSKVSFFGFDGFQHEQLLKISVQCRALSLVMLELAFGSDFAPVENLNVELRSNAGYNKKMHAVKYYLIPSRTHYYLLPCSGIIPDTGDSFNLLLSVESSGLRKCGPNGPLSDQRFRAALASNRKSSGLETCCNKAMAPTICLIPFADWLLFADPTNGDREFLISALYFDTLMNSRKYLTYVED